MSQGALLIGEGIFLIPDLFDTGVWRYLSDPGCSGILACGGILACAKRALESRCRFGTVLRERKWLNTTRGGLGRKRKSRRFFRDQYDAVR